MLGKESMAGCMGNLYSSAEKLEDPYVQQPGAATKDAVLCAAMPAPAAVGPSSWLLRLPAPAPAPAPAPKKLFSCNYYYSTTCNYYFTEVRGTGCPNCGLPMDTEAKLVGSPEPPVAAAAAASGFVQGGMATYTVTDDLVVSPMSNVSNIALLNACAVRDLGALQERTVQIGYKEGLEILRAALQSKTVLTDVFLGKKPPSPMKIGGAPALSNGRRHKSLTWRA
uniref:Uncharacterized protein n=1 Tax=Arundo donax TaxID=35708 RepID=A0A0A9CSJ8_ARUDO